MIARPQAALIAALAVLSAFCLALAGARLLYAHQLRFGFLAWNLLLAWIPLLAALGVQREGRRVPPRRGALVVAGTLWLLFFPNAPYIVTDLVHLEERYPVPLWFDALMIGSFAWTGLLLGLVSLGLVHERARGLMGAARSWAVVAAGALLGGFGIYIGRFLRWNSWDALRHPARVTGDLATALGGSGGFLRALGVTAASAALIAFSYAVLYAFARLPAPRSGDASRR